MGKRTTLQKLTESKHLNEKNVRNAKRERLVGKQRVAQQNREAFTAKTDKDATRATINRVGEYKKAKTAQFSELSKAKKENF